MSLNEKEIVAKIKKEYGSQEESKVERIIRLNKKVARPAEIIALAVGIIGSLILGFGMCLAMKIIMDAMALGIVIGCIGIFIISINYFLYKAILKRRKKKYGDEILYLANSI